MSQPSETREAILANADYHNRLLEAVANLEYAAPALAQHRSYIQDLETQLTDSERKLDDLTKKTKKERKEHEAIRDSTARRFAAKFTGKKEQFEAKESKEEREYVEALQNEMVERDHRDMLQQLLTEALEAKGDLEDKAASHESVKKELDSLYARVFDGPSQSFPEEDRLEYDVFEIHRRHEQTQQILNAESQATELLARACSLMDACQGKMSEALSYSRYDMMGGGSMADYMERNALTNAQACAAKAESLVSQATRISPRVQPVGHVNIATGSMMSDVFFDNFFTDRAFHRKIQASAAQVLAANARLKAERDAAMRRRDDAGNSVLNVGNELDAKRKELHQLRRALFESISSGVPRPPTYEHATNPDTDKVYAPPAGPPPGHPSAPPVPSSPPPAFPSPDVQPVVTAEPQGMSPASGQSSSSSPQGQVSAQSPRPWGSRNPYASALANRSNSWSEPRS